MKPICIDANVFLASTKGNETYSSDCKLTEVIRNITKYLGMEAEKTQENNLRRMVSIWEVCDNHFCTNTGYAATTSHVFVHMLPEMILSNKNLLRAKNRCI